MLEITKQSLEGHKEQDLSDKLDCFSNPSQLVTPPAADAVGFTVAYQASPFSSVRGNTAGYLVDFKRIRK